MLQIINPTEKLPVSAIVAVIYGDAGIGKTTLASQCENSLLLDFEHGAGRAKKRTLTSPVEKWKDVLEFIDSKQIEEMGIKTLIFDTAGTLLDRQLTEFLIDEDPKRGNSNGLALKGYGAMKKKFDSLINVLKAKNINMIFVAHKEQFKDGDDVKYRPKMTGGSYDILISVADLVGYYEARNGRRILNFNPTERTVGKNTAEFEPFEVPEYSSSEFDGFMQNLINKTKDRMSSLSQEQELAVKKMEGIREAIADAGLEDVVETIESAKELDKHFQVQINKLLTDRVAELWRQRLDVIDSASDADMLLEESKELPKQHMLTTQKMLMNKTKDLGFTFDKDSYSFIDPKVKETPETKEADTKKKEA